MALSKISRMSKTGTNIVKNLIIGFGFPQWFYTFMLNSNHPMVKLSHPVIPIPTWICPLTNIRSLKISASRQNDVSKFYFAFIPNGLTYYKFEVICLVHFYIAITIGLSSYIRRSIFVHHFYR